MKHLQKILSITFLSLAVFASGLSFTADPAYGQANQEQMQFCQNALKPLMDQRKVAYDKLQAATANGTKKMTAPEACKYLPAAVKADTALLKKLTTELKEKCPLPPEQLDQLKQNILRLTQVSTQACAAVKQSKEGAAGQRQPLPEGPLKSSNDSTQKKKPAQKPDTSNTDENAQ